MGETDANRVHGIIAAILCGAAALLSLAIGSFHQVGGFGVETDFYGTYAIEAKNIVSGQPYTYQHQPPGYALLLAAASFLVNDLFKAGKIISSLATGLFGWITYSLLKTLFDRKIALTTTVLVLVALIPYSFLAATDMVGALAMLLPVWVLLERRSLTVKACILGGIAAGAAYLMRSNGIAIIVGVIFSILVLNPGDDSVKRRLLNCAVFLTSAALTTLPWLVYNHDRNGSFLASTAYLQIAAYFFRGDITGTGARQMAAEFDSLGDVLLHDPSVMLAKYLLDVGYTHWALLTTRVLQFPLYVFAAGGFLLLFFDLSRRRMALFGMALPLYLLLGLVPFFPRYYLFFFPFLFLLVNYFLFHERINAVLGRLPFFGVLLRPVVFVILLALTSIPAYQHTQRMLNSEPRYLMEIANFLRDRSSERDIIIARKPHLGYLTGLKRTFPLVDSADHYLLEARRMGARYIVYSDEEASRWPGLKSLKHPALLSGDFKIIYRHEKSRTLVYEIDLGSRH
jgi:hypothetical protein